MAEAVLAVMPTREKGFNVDNVRVIKIMGDSLSESKVVRGMVFGRESDGMIKHATAAKVAVFTCALNVAQTETEGTMLIENADEMLNFTSGEEHLEKVRRFLTFFFLFLHLFFFFPKDRELTDNALHSFCR
ncbi:hypothetical protein PILCRDRAFT_529470 [Piloderma croceum F 1598]|uniref:Uncharacterized protein n=1 Tax=Piloderma croceum (strain F 1598) TaxID=765440 RepID=A0A0C3FLW4_PILCF|nr:hypothetical protein PILCRDRAFT_529470 [Piloderma croceum F 1598]